MFAIISLILACGEKGQDTANEPTDTATDTDTVTTDVASPFADSSFNLDASQTTGFTPISEIKFSTDSEFGFRFSGGCNSFSGEYSLENDVFRTNALSGTEMGCASDLMDEDVWLTEFFTSSPNWSFDDNVLVLSNARATLTFAMEATQTPRTPLVDTTWIVNSFVEGDAVTSINLTNIPTIIFSSDGSLSVNTGCNQGLGTYSALDSTIGVAIDNYSEATCPDTASSDAERIIVNVFMAQEVQYSITGNQLTLMNQDIGLIATGAE